ncbi:hypothetical protein IV203_001020 [Nitzschia inconspicua]|uniref:Uncharacterized protein n=1 Tax=Nitzschia inconspicua TaxID=303405 RepID=A0A9K3L709_9STRA|nr:hypothetical protein IV203_001020 [Nitzschia inconspicua]
MRVGDFFYILMVPFCWSAFPVSGFQVLKICHEWAVEKENSCTRRSHYFARSSFLLSEIEEDFLEVEDGSVRRRRIFQVVSSILLGVPLNGIGLAAVAEVGPSSNVPQVSVISGTVTLSSDVSVDPSKTSDAALYVTVRPDTPDNVPAAILSGTRGKAPPVMAARFPSPTFPFTFQMTSPQNLTPEVVLASDTSTASMLDISNVWWANDDLIVSVRWDSDGVAATRSPEDLVGRALWRRKSNERVIEIPLTGRGAFGKFVTGKN